MKRALLGLLSLTSLSASACFRDLDATQCLPDFSLLNLIEEQPDSINRDGKPEEVHLKNLQQLTFGGQNAEAYFDTTGKRIVFQSRQPQYPDEQIFTMNTDGSEKTLISTGLGRTTCSFFTPDGKRIYFSSTHAKDTGPQAPLDMSKGYVWKVNPLFSLYRTTSGSTEVAQSNLSLVLDRREYVAETTIAPNGKYLTFTGLFDGDLDIYRSDLDGKNIQRLTDEYGYDGGPFISWDSKKIVYRRATIANQAEREDYTTLLKQNMVRPGKLEIWIMNADGSGKRQVTRLGAASFAPFLHPNGRQIIFCSNYGDPKGREFDLFVINTDGTGFKRITHSPEFDGFPMFSRDGKKLIWSSNRFGSVRGETNIYTADWVAKP